MRQIKLLVAYDGSCFAGWQRQRDRPTVQEALEETLSEVVCHRVKIIGAGRTDRGVHALGQVAVFRTTSRIPTERIPLAANKGLPESVRVLEACEVPADFHPCLSARGKHYRYTVYLHRIAPPPLRHLVVPLPFELDLGAVAEALPHMVGRRDWKAFKSSAKGQQFYHTVKEIHALVVRKAGRFLTVDVAGSGFLYKQVRTMVGTLLEVGRGKLSPHKIQAIVTACERRQAGPTAPPQGLCLMQVFYGRVRSSWWRVQGPAVWAQRWEQVAAAGHLDGETGGRYNL